jgi:hypothetical protein
MTWSTQRVAVSRIIVGWQSHAAIDPSVEAATLLAAATEAEVVGLFVEDNDLIKLAGQPFVRPLTLGDDSSKPVTRATIVAAYARGATVCRRVLSAQAGKADVKWTFSTERGELPAKIRDIAASNDFVVLPGDAQGFGAKQLMDELRSSPTNVRGILLVGLRQPASQMGPVIAIDDGDDKGEHTIRLAVRIAMVRGRSLVLFVVAATDTEADQIMRRAEKLASPNVTLSARRFPPGSAQLIAAATGEFAPVFIVGDRQGEPFGDDKSVLSLLRACNAPVLLLR